ncbi:carboxypeptidase-like regulatory domain-containing protein [Algoriphagus aquimarinus]|uniref:CarboxypepD_reg-like domain-containing protein n=1 Tax=Algoriphagus aquimarinus TaxID=237018 RepID=A0A1I1B2C5_9BACT|nr:carboxypeptidase-like regulatory domain-containing protein [Algoriphagus aquimarinus]SFB44411.1 CarboxypepD_reg-like domain-containing protein [Algoriphagus aquimarinus]
MVLVSKNVILLLLLFSQFSLLYGQDSAFKGKIIDSQTTLPVPFASIKIKAKMLGVVSNVNGDFQIPREYSEEADSLIISCIGYTTKIVAFRDLQDTVLNLIKIYPSVSALDEVVVTPKKRKELSASRVLNLAINNLKVNYPQEPFSYIGYYRDYQLLDTNYLNLNEAIVEVYDRGFSSYDLNETLIELYEFRQNTDFPIDTATTKPYDNKPAKYGRGENKYIPNAVLSPIGGSELSILRLHDAIRNNDRFSFSFVDVFVEDFENNHFLKMEEEVYLDKTPLYCISFRSRFDAGGPRNFSEGKLFIEKDNFAIHKIEYSTFNKTMKETQLMYNIQTEYSRVGQYMYLNYISFNNGFKTQNDTDFKVIEITYSKEKKAFILDLNSVPEKTSVSDTSNYNFILDGKRLGIHQVLLTGERQVTLMLQESAAEIVAEYSDEMSSKLNMNTQNIRDVKNRELDKENNTTVFQFRELFVQKIFPSKHAPIDGEFIDKTVPLTKEVISKKLTEKEDYWMNSPLRRKQ